MGAEADAGADATTSDAQDPPEQAVGTDLPGLTPREVEELTTRVRQLKEDTFHSKVALSMLQELLIGGEALGSGVQVVHINELGKSYRIQSVEYKIDGRTLYQWETSQDDLPRRLDLRNETIPTGKHQLQINLVLSGNGGGVFTYVEGQTFTLRSNHDFSVRDGYITEIRVRATTKGSKRSAWEQRPKIVFETSDQTVKPE